MILRFFTRWQRAYRSFIKRSFLAGLIPNEQVAVWDALVSRDHAEYAKAGAALGDAFAAGWDRAFAELMEKRDDLKRPPDVT